jgi:hypothetical protein
LATPVDSRAKLQELGLGLIRSVLPAAKRVRLVGVTLSNFGRDGAPSLDLVDLATP